MTWVRTIGGVWHLSKPLNRPAALTRGFCAFGVCGTWIKSVISVWMMAEPPTSGICKRCAKKAGK